MSLFDTCCFTGHPPFFLPSLFSALLFSWFFLLLLFSFFLPNFLFSLPLLFPDPSPHHNINKTCSYALELFYASIWKLMVWQVGAARLDLFHIYGLGYRPGDGVEEGALGDWPQVDPVAEAHTASWHRMRLRGCGNGHLQSTEASAVEVRERMGFTKMGRNGMVLYWKNYRL